MHSIPTDTPRLGAVLRRALVLAALAGSVLGSAAHAQAVTPFYTPGDFMRSAYRFWYAPQAASFAEQAAALPAAITAVCERGDAAALAGARERWKATALAWDHLSGVQVGPLVQRRSSRQIDFTPTRPELIKRAIEKAPTDAAGMEVVGTPAKGLPALEWLLWKQPIAKATPACSYAVQVAADIEREAAALNKAFAELAAKPPGDNEAAQVPALAELVNQWTGGLERLRWGEMEKPRLSREAAFSRSASGQTGARWAAQWKALNTLGAAQGQTALRPGSAIAPLETYMRGLGRDAPADQLARAMGKADKAMRNLNVNNRAAVTSASRAIADVKKVAEAEVAPAMEVSLGFSDADGD